MTLFDKQALLNQIQRRLEKEVSTLRLAVEAAKEAATHEESKPENQYDTRGLEASYLAGAQRERLAEAEGALHRIKSTALVLFHEDSRVAPTALVEVASDKGSLIYFVLAVGAGYPLELNGQQITVITPQSPLGRALLGKKIGDEMTVRVGDAEKDFEILSIA